MLQTFAETRFLLSRLILTLLHFAKLRSAPAKNPESSSTWASRGDHAHVSPDPFIGPQGYMKILGMMRSGFPNIQWTLEEMVAENDTVAARFIMRGTHQATFFGVPASGKKIQVQAVNFYRFSNGKIVEERGQPDLMALLQQIGAVPA
ncbi:ester cyclase [Paraburkholderia nemoris]|uniref:ester cyclase n=1 Tax=Paraburkholderia nemoris TaxID=2793076 RepID=UPI001B8D9149|nr:ester cyclase [Paraburkholderia nemoris]